MKLIKTEIEDIALALIKNIQLKAKRMDNYITTH